MTPYLMDYDIKTQVKRKINKDNFYLWMNKTFSLFLAFIILLFIYYVWILNVNATKWYDIRKLEIEKQNLLLQKELLDVQISNLESFSSITSNTELNSIMEKTSSEEKKDFAIIRNWVNYAYNN
jgi:flagellar biosynthesis/type III secretory pathway M-ring protein FliF/YscJ